jgi:hypothetical protein
MSTVAFYSVQDAYELALLFQHHDANCRHDLSKGLITSERDYVSNLATHLRYPAGTIHNSQLSPAFGLPPAAFDGPITSYTMPPGHEKVLGCDGIIILSRPVPGTDEVLYKIGLFEAKWPRVFGGHQHIYHTKSGNQDRWDSKFNPDERPKKSRTPPLPELQSHFSNQLIRQHAWASTGIVIWEQFFSEQAIGSKPKYNFKKHGSTCILHDEAYEFMRRKARLNPFDSTETNGTWLRKHLVDLLSHGSTLSLASIIFGMAVCDYGKPIVGNARQLQIPPPNQTDADNPITVGNQFSNGITINLPNPDSPSAVHETMRKLGLSNYTHVSLSPEGIKRIETEESQRLREERRKKIDTLLAFLNSQE